MLQFLWLDSVAELSIVARGPVDVDEQGRKELIDDFGGGELKMQDGFYQLNIINSGEPPLVRTMRWTANTPVGIMLASLSLISISS